MPFNIYTIYQRVFKIWRKRRFQLFLDLMKPRPSDIMLDVGGNPEFWMSYPQPVERIDALNIHELPWNEQQAPGHRIRTIVGDGCALAMPDKSYDLGFSNSVIEHVGSWENQQRFASEIRRVGNAIWVQTPAYECPIEPHYLTPFIHYLPRAVQKSILPWGTVRGWIEPWTAEQVNDMVDSTRLLRKSEMHQLFPDCEIITEHLLGILPKSYIAIRRAA